jgi:hypothetical protein
MDERTVVALGIVLEHQLPIACDIVRYRARCVQLADVPPREPPAQRRERLRERFGLGRERDEHEALERRERRLMQRVLRAFEAGHLVHRARAEQRAVEAVRPRVVRALDRSAEAA